MLLMTQQEAVRDLGYGLIDCDSHYYEPYDCFTRHLERKYADRAVNIRHGDDGLGRIYIGDERLGYMSVIQTDYIAPPGAFQGLLEGKLDRSDLAYEPIRPLDTPAFMTRDARLALMDQQHIEACVMLPTLGVCVEHEMHHDVEASYANLRAFNRWVEEDWGFGQDGRIYSVALLSLLDVDLAVAELERVLDAGARLLHLKPGPVYGRSPADPCFDPFWARIQEAGVPVVFHVGDSGYYELVSTQWGEPARPATQHASAFQMTTCAIERPISDTIAALVLHNLFGRFPGVRVASIENGSEWLPGLLKKMDKFAEATWYGRWLGGRIDDRPSEIVRRHVSVCPFHEDDLLGLTVAIGAEQVLFGSDYPHPEGLAEPIDFARNLLPLGGETVRQVMRSNGRRLIGLDGP